MSVVTSAEATLIANPYVVGRPLTGASADLYVGREDVFAWLEENLLDAARPNALLLYGRRRIGKTSTLYQITEGERGRAVRQGDRPLKTAYVDLQRLAGRPTDEWLRRLAREICHRVNTSMLSRSLPDSPVAGESAYAVFERCLDRLEQTLPDDHLILLAVDELEQIRAGIDAGVLSPDVLPFFRSQIQHRERIAFLLCGSPALLEEFWRPITDLTARQELGALTYDETLALIRQPVEGVLAYEAAAEEAIWRLSGGQPFLVQTLCHRLVTLANRRHSHAPLEVQDVTNVMRQIAREGYSGEPAFAVALEVGS
jgi:hypothetical protein